MYKVDWLLLLPVVTGASVFMHSVQRFFFLFELALLSLSVHLATDNIGNIGVIGNIGNIGKISNIGAIGNIGNIGNIGGVPSYKLNERYIFITQPLFGTGSIHPTTFLLLTRFGEDPIHPNPFFGRHSAMAG